MMMIAFNVNAQIDLVTKFMGIPVKGNKADMIEKLEQKGFTYIESVDCLEGEFNGSDVYVFVNTTKGEVDRVVVADKNRSNESDIIMRYNNLLYAFENNDKYISVDNDPIKQDENICYEMTINHKRYSASLFQKISEEDIRGLTELLKENIDTVEKILLVNANDEDLQMYNDCETEEEKIAFFCYFISMEAMKNNLVWFNINGECDNYYIAIFYENTMNRPNGDDL